jgi:pimeloyl-ACP methyl ester carboxylesterase
VYRPTLTALAREHRAVVFEMPGSGRAAKLPEPWTLEDYACWAAGAFDALGLADVTVVGHSQTGAVAVLMAALYPARVGRLVITGGCGVGTRQSLGRAVLGRVADSLTVECGLAAREWSTVAHSLAAHTRNFLRQTRLSLDADVAAVAAGVKLPALVAWGARDHTTPRRSAEAWERALPRSELYLSPGGSHAWLITHAGEFAARVADFIRRSAEQWRYEAARRAVEDAGQEVTIESAPRAVDPATGMAVAGIPVVAGTG